MKASTIRRPCKDEFALRGRVLPEHHLHRLQGPRLRPQPSAMARSSPLKQTLIHPSLRTLEASCAGTICGTCVVCRCVAPSHGCTDTDCHEEGQFFHSEMPCASLTDTGDCKSDRGKPHLVTTPVARGFQSHISAKLRLFRFARE